MFIQLQNGILTQNEVPTGLDQLMLQGDVPIPLRNGSNGYESVPGNSFFSILDVDNDKHITLREFLSEYLMLGYAGNALPNMTAPSFFDQDSCMFMNEKVRTVVSARLLTRGLKVSESHDMSLCLDVVVYVNHPASKG
jgi:hypothetical protein